MSSVVLVHNSYFRLLFSLFHTQRDDGLQLGFRVRWPPRILDIQAREY